MEATRDVSQGIESETRREVRAKEKAKKISRKKLREVKVETMFSRCGGGDPGIYRVKVRLSRSGATLVRGASGSKSGEEKNGWAQVSLYDKAPPFLRNGKRLKDR